MLKRTQHILQAVSAVAVMLSLPGMGAIAQVQSTAQAQTSAPAPLAPQPQAITCDADISFAQLAAALHQHTYGADQTRRFRAADGSMVEVNEHLIVAPTASGDPLFSLAFVGVVGQQVGSAEYSHWQATYQRYASLFHEHGSFRVRDAAAAASNYSILNFGQCVRANRAAYRAIILPHRLDKSIWLIDIDAITGLVLYSAEYDPSARLLGELEVTQLLSAQSIGRLPANWQWRPLSVVTAYPDIDHAIAYLAAPGLVRPRISDIAGEYSQSRVQVTESPLNLVRSLVVTFTDGIDEFFVIETPGQSNPLDHGPAAKGKKGPSHTIAYYDDPSLRVYMFGEGSVMFEMVGHGAMLRLGLAAKRVYTQAITHT